MKNFLHPQLYDAWLVLPISDDWQPQVVGGDTR